MNHLSITSGKPGRVELVIYISLCTAIFSILALRAIYVPVCHDEATTFFNYVQRADFVPFLAKGEANNHFLNSALTFLSVRLFGSSPLALRLPNLLFLLVYFFIIFKLSKEIESGILRWIFIPVMLFTFNIMEYFALCRGYGISLTLLMAAIWQTLLGSRDGKAGHFLISNLLMLFSSLAILLEVYNFALLLLWSLLMILLFPGRKKVWKLLAVGFSGILSMLLIAAIALHLQKAGAYYDKGLSGLWNASLMTLFSMIIGKDLAATRLPLMIFAGLIFLSVLLLLVAATFNRKWKPAPGIVFPFLLFGNLAIIVIIVRFIFHDYPEGRLILFLFPIAVSALVFVNDTLVRLTRYKWLVILSLPLLLFPVRSVQQVDFEHIIWYNYCHIPRRFYHEIMDKPWSTKELPTVGGHGMQAWAWQFIVREQGCAGNEMQTSGFPDLKTGFIIAELKNLHDWQQSYDTIDYDPASHLRLLRKKPVTVETPVREFLYEGTKYKQNAEFQEILRYNFPEGGSKDFELVFDLSLQSFARPLHGTLVIEIADSTKKTICYEALHLNWIRENWDGSPGNFHRSWIAPALSSPAARLKVYIWNTGGTDYAILDGKVRLLETH